MIRKPFLAVCAPGPCNILRSRLRYDRKSKGRTPEWKNRQSWPQKCGSPRQKGKGEEDSRGGNTNSNKCTSERALARGEIIEEEEEAEKEEERGLYIVEA